MMPKLAEQIHAPIINAPWRKMNILDFDFRAPTSPSPCAALETILSLSCFWMSPVSFTRPLASITWYCSFSKSQMLPPEIVKVVLIVVFVLNLKLITYSCSCLALPGAGNPSILARELRPCRDPVPRITWVLGVSPQHLFIARIVWVVTWRL